MASTELHEDATSPELLSLLRQLMAEPVLGTFVLAGGTALALYFGHRRSLDLDLFCREEFAAAALAEALRGRHRLESLTIEPNTVRCAIQGIRVDFLAHRYDTLERPLEIAGIRIFGLPDLAAMKLNAIANRGSRKDFWDVAELLSHFSFEEMLAFHARKYPDTNLWQVRKSVAYFADAEPEPDPVVLNGRTWETVREQVAGDPFGDTRLPCPSFEERRISTCAR